LTPPIFFPWGPPVLLSYVSLIPIQLLPSL
jgi:hypothetical protein